MKKSLAPFVIIALLAIVGVLVYLCIPTKGGKDNAIAGLEEPVQTELKKTDETGTSFKKAGYDVDVTYLYKYDIDALVVSTHDYPGIGIQDQLSPRDLGVAWGKVAELNTTIDFQWRQGGRFLFWNIDDPDDYATIGGAEGMHCCSNNHIIPADSTVKKQLKKVQKGDHIKVHGYLVSIEGDKSSLRTFTWNSSTSRLDEGDGACEVIYTTSIEIIE